MDHNSSTAEATLSDQGPDGNPTITIERPVFDQITFDKTFDRKRDDELFSARLRRKCRKHCTFSRSCFISALTTLFPFIEILRTYKWKSWILFDLIAGLCVSIIHIPQGMGFALLTSVPAVYGLYSSFWPVLIYFFFAHSRHNSFGTMAIISLIIGTAVEREAPHAVESLADDIANATNQMSSNGSSDDAAAEILIKTKIGLALTCSLLIGLIQLGMGICRLGIMTTFMPKCFISGFTTGAAFHILTSQLKLLFGIKVKRFGGIFRLPLTLIDFFSKIGQTNVATLVISIVTIVILIVVKEIINVRFKSKMKMPIPAELIVVIISTLCSFLVKFDIKWDVAIVGNMPPGMPAPIVPPLQYAGPLFVDAIIGAILSFVISFSMASIFTQKYNYSIDSNQELLAYGISHSVGAFFNSFAGASAPPRCFVHDSSGGKTLVATLFSCVVILLVILWIGPLFQNLPNAVLGSIIVVAIIPLFKQIQDVISLWKVNKVDFLIWLITWAAVVFLDLGIGIAIGVAFVIFSVVAASLCRRGYSIGTVGLGGVYVPVTAYGDAQDLVGIRIFRFDSTLYFASVLKFKKELFKRTRLNPQTMKTNPSATNEIERVVQPKADNIQNGVVSTTDPDYSESDDDLRNEPPPVNDSPHQRVHTLILDCSPFTYVDVMALNALKQLGNDYKAVGVNMVLSNVGQEFAQKIHAADLSLPVYPTLDDAIVACQHHIHKESESAV